MTNDERIRIFYNSSEMAKMCGISRKTWCTWVRKGHAPAPVIINGARKWLVTDVDKWLKKLRKENLGVG